MKKVLATLLVAIVLVGVNTSIVHAQASFLFGVAVGAMATSGDTITAPSSAMIIYTMLYASERVKEPLSIQFASTNLMRFSRSGDGTGAYMMGSSIHALFRRVEPQSERFEVLQVVRVFDPADPSRAAFWFAYIPKQLVLPLGSVKK